MINKTKQWVHFIGICSPVMSGIAVLLKNKGYKVTGTDKDIYPPTSDFLIANNIEIVQQYKKENIKDGIDLVIYGGAAFTKEKVNEEFIEAKKRSITMQSWTDYIGTNLIKDESIVVAGTYGKTTTTAMIAYILTKLNLDPSYLVGGFAVDLPSTVVEGEGKFSVVEGDEYPSVYSLDDSSKFMHFKPKYLLLTSAKWDHFNIFPEVEDYLKRFRDLVDLIPSDGLIVACSQGEYLKDVTQNAKCRVVWYSRDEYQENLNILGSFNRENAAGALALLKALDIDEKSIKTYLPKFNGVKRRLEKRYESEKCVLIEDYAQHPFKVMEGLKVIKAQYPDRKIYVVFDPFASTVRVHSVLESFSESFQNADKVIVRRVHMSLEGNERVTGPEIVKAIGPKAEYVPLDENIVKQTAELAIDTKCVILFCSSGPWNGLIENTLKEIKNAD